MVSARLWAVLYLAAGSAHGGTLGPIGSDTTPRGRGDRIPPGRGGSPLSPIDSDTTPLDVGGDLPLVLGEIKPPNRGDRTTTRRGGAQPLVLGAAQNPGHRGGEPPVDADTIPSGHVFTQTLVSSAAQTPVHSAAKPPVHGAAKFRVSGAAKPPAGDVTLADLIRDTPAVQGHKDDILQALQDVFPYSEGPFNATSGLEPYKQCFYLRKMMRQEPGEVNNTIHINPHNDLNVGDIISGPDDPEPIEVTQSVAKINTERTGWQVEDSSELGISGTATAGANFEVFSASLSTTVYGNHRFTNGKNGDSTKQTEERVDNRLSKVCPPNSICRVVTWTYTRTIQGHCMLIPFRDMSCLSKKFGLEKDSGLAGNVSIALLGGDSESSSGSFFHTGHRRQKRQPDAIDWVKEEVKEVKDKAVEVFEDAEHGLETMEKKVEDVAVGIGEGVKKAEEKVVEVVKGVEKKAEDVAIGIGEGVKKAEEKVVEVVKGVEKKVEDVAVGIGNEALQAEKAVEDLITKGPESLIPPVDKLIHQISQREIEEKYRTNLRKAATTYFHSDTAQQGPEWQGIQLQDLTTARPKFDERCSFSYPLRWEDGRLVRAQALITTELKPVPPKGPIPKAIGIITDKRGDKSCVLERGWFWQPGGFFLVPIVEGGTGKWAQFKLDTPSGVSEKCGGLLGTGVYRRDTASPENTHKTPIKIEMLIDDLPEFIQQQEAKK